MIAIYARVSSKKKKGVDRSIRDQISEGKAFAKRIGEVFKVFNEGEGVSGASDDLDERPVFQEMLEQIKAGDLDKVYCIDQSRIERGNKYMVSFYQNYFGGKGGVLCRWQID
jgi:DNA invertase Pin-like site-specific DNA recombinase